MKLRPYQREAVDSIYSYFHENTGNPLVVLPTGSGKSLVQATFVREVIEQWPSQRFLLLTHVKELLQQNGAELVRCWPEAEMRLGYYSAGLKSRDTGAQITIAGIQSIHRRAHEIGQVDLILIDECHLVPPKGAGMYRRFMSELRELCPAVKVVGMTATPFRLGTGLLHRGRGALFSDICYSADIKGLIDDGYLAPLTTKLAKDRADLSTVKVRGGEYVAGDLDRVMGDKDVIRGAVAETVDKACDRKKLLVFCSGVDHALAVRDEFREQGVSCETIIGSTPKEERDALIESFKQGEFRALTSVNVLTTGFNVPDIDCLVLLRPTKSTALYVQTLGRGMRTAPGKTDCLVLDFTDNILEHGPIDKIQIKPKNESDGDEISKAPMKACPECNEPVPISARECPCGYEFEIDSMPKHSARAHIGAPVLSAEKLVGWADVHAVDYSVHSKPGKPNSMKVTYRCGLRDYHEWVCIEHEGFPRQKAEGWWARRTESGPAPERAADAVEQAYRLAKRPTRIMIDSSGKYERIIRHVFE